MRARRARAGAISALLHSRVFWHGREYVATMGDATGQLHGGDLEQIDKAIDHARFFERDGRGDLPCPKTGRCIRVSCTDTSSSKLAITRGAQTNQMDYTNCGSVPELEALVDLLDKLARTQQWIGSRRY